MSLQCTRLREGHMADVALEGLLPCVSALVHDEVRALVKDLIASGELANVQGPLALGNLVPRENSLASFGIDLRAKIAPERLFVLMAFFNFVQACIVIDVNFFLILHELSLCVYIYLALILRHSCSITEFDGDNIGVFLKAAFLQLFRFFNDLFKVVAGVKFLIRIEVLDEIEHRRYSVTLAQDAVNRLIGVMVIYRLLLLSHMRRLNSDFSSNHHLILINLLI